MSVSLPFSPFNGHALEAIHDEHHMSNAAPWSRETLIIDVACPCLMQARSLYTSCFFRSPAANRFALRSVSKGETLSGSIGFSPRMGVLSRFTYGLCSVGTRRAMSLRKARRAATAVMPAQAGIQGIVGANCVRPSGIAAGAAMTREGHNRNRCRFHFWEWIPACAGMTQNSSCPRVFSGHPGASRKCGRTRWRDILLAVAKKVLTVIENKIDSASHISRNKN
jgi:hypothetical protein